MRRSWQGRALSAPPALESLFARFAALPDARRGHGLKHRPRFVLACAAVSTLMGACGYRAFENTCQKFTQRQLRALGGQRNEDDQRYYPPSDSPFLRVLQRLDAGAFATLVGGWLAVSPEASGPCGCWQVIAVARESLDLTVPDDPASVDIGYYATSLTVHQGDESQLLEIIRGHWSAIENGTHYRRDVTLGEDANRTAHRHGAAVLASLRNLANGIYELAQERGRTAVATLKSWCQQQTFTTGWPLRQH